MTSRFTSYVSVAAFLVGCGPSLSQVTRTTQAFAVQQKCAQGPFEVHVPAYGSKWGEDVTLEARGANAIDGHATVTIDGQEVATETFSSGGASSNACMLSDADRAAAVTGGAPVQMPSTTSTNTNTSSSTSTSTSGNVALLPAGMPGDFATKTEIAHIHREVNDWVQAPNALKKGQDVKIVFWSEHPLDLSSITFVLTHSEMVPPGGDDKKWAAHLDDVRSDAQKKQREEEAKANEQTRCENLDGHDKKCADEGYKTRTERMAYADFQHRCEEMARRNATDKACRDDGWRNESERPDSNEPPHVTNLALAQPATTVEAKQERAADRPPPAPQTETQPPKPSEHAEWVPGSWKWNGTNDWVWLSGGWRVPEQDRAQHLTATAPSAPPAVRVEAPPPQPIASAVWAQGYWHWSGGQWIWVPGHWAMPPRAGATWRPSTYVQEGVQLRLDPGGWILH
jgi:hypothetical protein